MAKIDDVIDRLERLTNDVNQVKLSLIGLLPLPPVAKPVVRRASEGIDPILTELYFDTLRGGVDLARQPSNQMILRDAILGTGQPIKSKKPRSRAQKRNDKMQSNAFKMANEKLRTKSGALRKGVKQSDVAKRAQKELKLMKRGKGKAGGRPSPSGGTRKRKSPGRSGGGRR